MFSFIILTSTAPEFNQGHSHIAKQMHMFRTWAGHINSPTSAD